MLPTLKPNSLGCSTFKSKGGRIGLWWKSNWKPAGIIRSGHKWPPWGALWLEIKSMEAEVLGRRVVLLCIMGD